MDGIITSPGGWGKTCRTRQARASFPGLLFYTYFLIADKAWFERCLLPSRRRSPIPRGVSVTDKWSEMQADDARLVADLVSRGLRIQRCRETR